MLVVNHVRKDFGSVRAVSDVHFSIDDATTFGLLGPNGAGKTTTMRMILGILVPDAGSVTWNGAAIHDESRRHFGYLPEERGIYGKMKVREQIAYFAKLHRLREPEVSKRVDSWIERLGLNVYADRPCAELSKGNQQKVQVACASVHGPQLLVLDEPFSGLDPVNAEILIGVLGELKANGTTLILSSHQMWQLEELCERFCIIAGGSNRVEGTLAQLRSAWPTRVVRVGFAGTEESSEYTVPADTDFAAMLREFVAKGPVTKFEALEPSLHEIYLRAIGENAA
ncbi:MAG TPA: ATP-binding cassette domain-containing protein [Candidatus Acidoferrales bacterium]|nr:ATP-binding cassette domain-containing protein [Candidatus Acidoferrales bacterium]